MNLGGHTIWVWRHFFRHNLTIFLSVPLMLRVSSSYHVAHRQSHQSKGQFPWMWLIACHILRPGSCLTFLDGVVGCSHLRSRRTTQSSGQCLLGDEEAFLDPAATLIRRYIIVLLLNNSKYWIVTSTVDGRRVLFSAATIIIHHDTVQNKTTEHKKCRDEVCVASTIRSYYHY